MWWTKTELLQNLMIFGHLDFGFQVMEEMGINKVELYSRVGKYIAQHKLVNDVKGFLSQLRVTTAIDDLFEIVKAIIHVYSEAKNAKAQNEIIRQFVTDEKQKVLLRIHFGQLETAYKLVLSSQRVDLMLLVREAAERLRNQPIFDLTTQFIQSRSPASLLQPSSSLFD